MVEEISESDTGVRMTDDSIVAWEGRDLTSAIVYGEDHRIRGEGNMFFFYRRRRDTEFGLVPGGWGCG